jgi:tetratricopeptide (TPR) repeat protein
MKHAREAVELYRKAGHLRAEMVAAAPRDARAAMALVSEEWRIGWALARAGDRGGAREAFQKAVRAGETMVGSLPDKSVGTRALADACWNIGLCYRDELSSCAQALPWFTRARGLFRQLNQPTQTLDKALAECAPTRQRP